MMRLFDFGADPIEVRVGECKGDESHPPHNFGVMLFNNGLMTRLVGMALLHMATHEGDCAEAMAEFFTWNSELNGKGFGARSREAIEKDGYNAETLREAAAQAAVALTAMLNEWEAKRAQERVPNSAKLN